MYSCSCCRCSGINSDGISSDVSGGSVLAAVRLRETDGSTYVALL